MIIILLIFITGTSLLKAKAIVSQKNPDLRAKSTRSISEPKLSSDVQQLEGLRLLKHYWNGTYYNDKQEDEEALEVPI